MEPLRDANGYPAEQTLDAIRTWPHDYRALMAFIRPIWKFATAGYWRESDAVTRGHNVRAYTLSTGGWSGNESIIGALCDNTMFWSVCWESSRRGGVYEFEIRK